MHQRPCRAGRTSIKFSDLKAATLDWRFPSDAALQLAGLPGVLLKAILHTLSSGNSLDENTLDDPLKVSPGTTAITVSGTNFIQVFPANSLSILRLQPASKSKELQLKASADFVRAGI
jgi:hypothetical protein